MKNDPTSPVTNAIEHSKTSARLKRTTATFMRLQKWLLKYEIDLFILISLIGGAILFVMSMRLISGA